MMFRIAVCDNDTRYRSELLPMIEECLKKMSIESQIDTFDSEAEFYELADQINMYEAAFLGVDMCDIESLKYIEQIQERYPDLVIVLLTHRISYSYHNYKIDPLRYLVKESNSFEAALTECFEVIFINRNLNSVKVEFEFTDSSQEVAVDSIVCIESKPPQLEFTVFAGNLVKHQLVGSIEAIRDCLGTNRFVCIDYDFLVHLKHIKTVSGNKVLLDTGREISVPRSEMQGVKESFITYRGGVS